jgi:hypothetical protein
MRHHWTPATTRILCDLYPDVPAADVAALLGCGLSTVYNKAFELRLKKSESFKASDMSARIQRGQHSAAMIATRFKPGSVPHNKGKPGITGHHPNTRRTQFKPGRAPEANPNYVPIGSLRFSKDGYLERKVNDTHPVPARRWVGVHRLVWEAAHGTIPARSIVVFKPGQRTANERDITADRLECITRAENARRNHPRTKHPELGRLIQLKGAITRQVNRIAKEAKERTA